MPAAEAFTAEFFSWKRTRRRTLAESGFLIWILLNVLFDLNTTTAAWYIGGIRTTHTLLRAYNSATTTTTTLSSHPPVSSTRRKEATSYQRIISLGRSGRTEQALALFKALPPAQCTVRHLNAVLDACVRARPTPRLVQAQLLFESHAAPNVYTFGTLLSGCARVGDVERALDWYQQMRNYNVTPNAVIHHVLLHTCSKAGRADLACSLLVQITRARDPITVVGFNAVLDALARQGEYQTAYQLVCLMEQHNTDQPRLPVWDEMDPRLEGIGPGAAPDVLTYATLLVACERAQQWTVLLQVAQHMQARHYRLDALALTSVLHACQQLGRAPTALAYWREYNQTAYARTSYGMDRRAPLQGPDAVAYLLIISACARGGQWQDGMVLLDEFQAAAAAEVDQNTMKELSVLYTAALTGCEYAGAWQAAFALLDRMRRSNIPVNEGSLIAIIGACGKACAQERLSHERKDKDVGTGGVSLPLKKAIQLMSAARKDPTVMNPTVMMYNAAIKACAEGQDFERAMKLFQIMQQEDGLVPTEVTFGSLMTACERVGSIDGMVRVFELIKTNNVTPNEIVYGAALSCCRKANEGERALQLLREMIQNGLRPNVVTFNTAMMAQINSVSTEISSGDLQRAMLVYKILYSGLYSSTRPNRQTYAILIRACNLHRQPWSAETLLQRVATDPATFGRPDVDWYTSTVAAYEKVGEPVCALRLMEAMRADGYDFYESGVLNAAFKKALAVTSAAIGPGPRAAASADPLLSLEIDRRALESFVQGHGDDLAAW
jgi:pentatricopeptide repeat domain-containing protein 1